MHPQIIALMLALSLPSLALADTLTYSFISGDKKVGHQTAETAGDQTTIDYDVKNNGCGPTIAESITLDAAGLPTEWTVKGTTTFGSKVAELKAIKTISMVVQDGTVYYPSEVYPKFGIQPFVAAPKVQTAAAKPSMPARV